MGLADFLIIPIQRVTRYILLLKGTLSVARAEESGNVNAVFFMFVNAGLFFFYPLADLKKHTAVTNPDYTDLDRATKMVTGLALAMNHAQKRN